MKKNILYKLFFLFAIFGLLNLMPQKASAQTCSGGPVYTRQKLQTCTNTNTDKSCTPGSSRFCKCTKYCPAFNANTWIAEYCWEQGTSSACNNLNTAPNSDSCKIGSCTWNPPPASCAGGTYCNNVAVGGGSHGTVVCGGGNINYRCNNGTWTSQGSFCNMCGQSITTNSIGAYPGLVGNLGWSAVSNINRYRLRIDDQVDGWIVSGQCPNGWTGPDYCGDLGTNSFNWTAIAGHSYHWWVDACGANDVCTAATAADVTAPSAPVNGSCSATHNNCSAGTSSDIADSPTQYLWRCVGSNGGSTASCTENIPINGVCSATHNNCSAGTSSDIADSPTQYLWRCVGSNGGSTASCSENMPLPAYYKLKDTSFYKQGFLSSNFPIGYTAYDASDTVTGGYFNQGEAGMVISTGSTLSAGSGGTAISGSSGNIRNWTVLNYSGSNAFTSTSYTNYVKAKRNATPVPDLASIPSGGAGGTYSLASGNVTISPATSIPASYVTIMVNGDLTLNTSDIGRDGVVFIVTGDVTVNGAGAPVKFNGTNRPFALISTGTIAFANTLTEADGLYVGNAIEFGTGTTALKIVGNVSSATPSSFDRDRGTSAPSMFIVFDPRHLLGIVDKVSTVKSSWRQLQ